MIQMVSNQFYLNWVFKRKIYFWKKVLLMVPFPSKFMPCARDARVAYENVTSQQHTKKTDLSQTNPDKLPHQSNIIKRALNFRFKWMVGVSRMKCEISYKYSTRIYFPIFFFSKAHVDDIHGIGLCHGPVHYIFITADRSIHVNTTISHEMFVYIIDDVDSKWHIQGLSTFRTAYDIRV